MLSAATAAAAAVAGVAVATAVRVLRTQRQVLVCGTCTAPLAAVRIQGRCHAHPSLKRRVLLAWVDEEQHRTGPFPVVSAMSESGICGRTRNDLGSLHVKSCPVLETLLVAMAIHWSIEASMVEEMIRHLCCGSQRNVA